MVDFTRDLLGIRIIYGHITIGAKNIDRAVAWYCEKLGLSIKPGKSCDGEEYLGYQEEDKVLVVLIQIPDDRSETAGLSRHPILFTKEIEKVHARFVSKGVVVWPVQNDSGGNLFFQFKDSEGNIIEMCLEPGYHK
jgi:catechol 2,3-dioxygenase-like lactoylglutathione lyase family enzyme